MDKFANRLIIAMDAAGMSAADLARKLGISDAIISQYRNGKYRPRQDRLYQISQILGVSPAWLIGLDQPVTEEQINSELAALIEQLDETEKARAIDYIQYMIARRKD